MALIATALIVGAAGAGASAAGAAKNADKAAENAQFAATLKKRFSEEQQDILDDLISDKQDKLININSILERFGGGPSAGTEENLELLRKSQNDFLKLGAGDFSGFTDQLSDIMAETMAGSFGSGAPVGQFTQLSAQNMNNLRLQGLDTGTRIGNQLGSESFNLLGAEFGLMDEGFQGQQALEEFELGGMLDYLGVSSETAGAGAQAAGSALTSVAGSLFTAGMGAGGDLGGGFLSGLGGGGFTQGPDPIGSSTPRMASERPSFSSAKTPIASNQRGTSFTPRFSSPTFTRPSVGDGGGLPRGSGGDVNPGLLPPMGALSNNTQSGSLLDSYLNFTNNSFFI